MLDLSGDFIPPFFSSPARYLSRWIFLCDADSMCGGPPPSVPIKSKDFPLSIGRGRVKPGHNQGIVTSGICIHDPLSGRKACYRYTVLIGRSRKPGQAEVRGSDSPRLRFSAVESSSPRRVLALSQIRASDRWGRPEYPRSRRFDTPRV